MVHEVLLFADQQIAKTPVGFSLCLLLLTAMILGAITWIIAIAVQPFTRERTPIGRKALQNDLRMIVKAELPAAFVEALRLMQIESGGRAIRLREGVEDYPP